MKPKRFVHRSLRPLGHPSGWPWMTAKCCGSRVNHCAEVVAISPQRYGDTVATHSQERSCKCGKTVLIVEGTLELVDVVGCFRFTRP